MINMGLPVKLDKLARTIQDITSCVDNGERVDIIFLDYRKAWIVSP